MVFGFLSVQHRLADLRTTAAESQSVDCEREPEWWVAEVGVLTVWAYDPEGRSRNTHAPPLPPERIPAEVSPAAHIYTNGAVQIWEWASVQRVAESGPCAVLYATFPERIPVLPGMQRAGLVGMTAGLVIVLLGTVLFAVRPLLRRIDRLDEAAQSVGTPGFAPIPDGQDDELGRVARTLNTANERICADQAELARQHGILERHLSAVAHDLRTPLAALQLTLEALQEQVPAAAIAEVGEARLEVAYLEALADNLHHATRLEGGAHVRCPDAPVDLCVILQRVVTRLRILGRARAVAVEAAVPDAPVRVACDPALAERALANLVHNAVIHGAAAHAVGVALDRDEGGFTLTISSNGDALTPAAIAALAQRRLSTVEPARARQGHGLGVAIANEVATRAGWQIRWEPLGEGGLQVVIQGEVMAG